MNVKNEIEVIDNFLPAIILNDYNLLGEYFWWYHNEYINGEDKGK